MTETRLPVLEILPGLLAKLSEAPLVLLEAPTGAGKSTGLPLQLLKEEKGKIIMLQPRRLAAKSVARRLAQQLGEAVGQTVGYRVRFDSQVSANTKLEVVTEGILTRMLQHDNALEGISLLIFDEFHERSLQADLALTLCRDMQAILRPDLRILVMSATLNSEVLSEKLGAPVVKSLGRNFPVKLEHWEPEPNQTIAEQVSGAVRRAVPQTKGDILVFLPGSGEIKQVAEKLENWQVPAVVHQLYGDLPPDQQDAALLPDAEGRQKVILATSIAETSLTIAGITTVIDSGWSRRPVYEPKNGLTSLQTVRLSLATAAQRSGRAGRLGPGKAIRLWSKPAESKFLTDFPPEILEADLSTLVLELAEWGTNEPNELPWVDAPPKGYIKSAKSLLTSINALSAEGKITEEGREINRLPTHPRIAHLLVHGNKQGLGSLACLVAALLEERSYAGARNSTDISLAVEKLNRDIRQNSKFSQQTIQMARQWAKLLSCKVDCASVVDTDVGYLLSLAYPERIAQAERVGVSFRYRLASGQWASLPEGDSLFHNEWIAIGAYDAGRKEGKIFSAAPLAPEYITSITSAEKNVRWNTEREAIESVVEKRVGVLVASRSRNREIEQEDVDKLFCELFRQQGVKIFKPDEATITWLNRLQSLHTWLPELEFPDFSEKALKDRVEDWLPPYLLHLRKLSELQKLNLKTILTSTLPYHLQNEIDTLAPPRLEVPSGSTISLQYFADGSPPVLAVRLQEVFGMPATPVIAKDKVPVLMHLLSPGYKPVQVTQDLASFWNTTYAEVRKELRGRYSKHYWPENPWEAEAVRGVRRKKQ
jgi:ATP-dependent helicase HrpB